MKALELVNYEGTLEDFISSANLEESELKKALITALNGNWIRSNLLKAQVIDYLQGQVYKVRLLTKVMKPGHTEWRESLRAPYYDYATSYREAERKRALDTEAFESGVYNFRPSSLFSTGLYSRLDEKLHLLLNTCSEEQRIQIEGYIIGKENKCIAYLDSIESNYKKPEGVIYLSPFQDLLVSIFNSRKIIEVNW